MKIDGHSTESEELFFFGEFEFSLDTQCRVSVPKDWRRDKDAMRLILFPGRDNDLLLFPFEAFRSFLLKARKVSLANKAAQIALARIGARARECRIDKQGRIKIEKRLLDSINVEKQLMLIGAVTHIKICAPQQWTESNLADDVYLDEFQRISELDENLGQILSDLKK